MKYFLPKAWRLKICPQILAFEILLVRIIIFMDVRNIEF